MLELRERMDNQLKAYLRKIEKEEMEEKERNEANRFNREWRNRFDGMSNEQKESYYFMRDHKIRFNTQSDSMLEFELEQIKKD